MSGDELPAGSAAGPGQCVDPDFDVAWVDNSDPNCADNDGRSATTPVCEIADALAVGRNYIRVAGSDTAYQSLNVANQYAFLVFVGPGLGGTPASIVPATGPGVALSGGRVRLDGFDITGVGVAGPAIACTVSQLLIVTNSNLHDAGSHGIDSNSCTLTVDATMIGGNAGAGLSLANATSYTVTNNFIVNNGTNAGRPGILISDAGSTGTIAFNTISGNGTGANAGGVSCPAAGANKDIVNSIVVNNSKKTGTQLAGKCALTNVVTGTDGFAGATQLTPTFVATDDFHLDVAAGLAANQACCIDQIMSDPGTPNSDHDVDHNPRPLGAGWDIGAHEAM